MLRIRQHRYHRVLTPQQQPLSFRHTLCFDYLDRYAWGALMNNQFEDSAPGDVGAFYDDDLSEPLTGKSK